MQPMTIPPATPDARPDQAPDAVPGTAPLRTVPANPDQAPDTQAPDALLPIGHGPSPSPADPGPGPHDLNPGPGPQGIDQAAEARLFARLDALDIAHATVRHPPAHSVADAKRLRGALAGGHAKNLFLKSKKDEYALVVMGEDDPVDVQALARGLGLARLSFASPARLWGWLGVRPGSVTPFALLNAAGHPERARLRVVFDADLLAHDPLWFHPLHNAATTAIAGADLIRFARDCGLDPLVRRIADFTTG